MIEVLERLDVDTFETVGRWNEEEGWVDGGERLDFEHSEHYTEDMMLDRFNGPTLFARRVEARKSNVQLSLDDHVAPGDQVDFDIEEDNP